MKSWIPCELHTHTLNSDGCLTLQGLADKAKDLGLECIALTDHNTISGHLDIESAAKQTGIHIIPGLEWTTFYGHMVAMGITEYVDWRNRGPADIHKGIADVHSAGGLVGVAHPYRLGSPMCTGCHWQFEISDWNDVDYLEVWSETFPSVQSHNKRAFDLWTDLLNKGHRITAVSGRDWHGDGSGDEPLAVTYLGINKDENASFNKAAVNALKNGCACITMGPLMVLTALSGSKDRQFVMGEKVKKINDTKVVEVTLDIDLTARKGRWKLDEQPMTAVLMSNKGNLIEIDVECNSIWQTVSTEGIHWLRAELYGSIDGIRTMIAFTNPIYFVDEV